MLPRLLADRPEVRAVCLVQPRWASVAARTADRLSIDHPHTAGRLVLVEGDIVEPGLGLAGGTWQAGVREVFHFAAAYDLTLSRAVAMSVNVEGTRHVLDACDRFPALARLHHVSTCYVSGRHPGMFHESDLDVGQTFNNFYEESKALAEREVRGRMAGGLPATIYRPSVVVGDSRTGETAKFDGPYCILDLLLRQPRVAVLPVPGRPDRTLFNVVPADFVARALAWLSRMPGAGGGTYALADPAPSSIDHVIALMARATGRRVVRLPVPFGIARAALGQARWLRRLLGVTPQALDYFTHPTTYDTTNADRDLAPGRIVVPPFGTYVERLAAFMRAHPEIGSAGLR